MKAKNLKFSGLFLAIALMFFTSSCSKDNDDVSNSAALHTIRYEVVAANEADINVHVNGFYVKMAPIKSGTYYLSGKVYAESDHFSITNNTPNLFEDFFNSNNEETLPWSYEFKGNIPACLWAVCREEKDIICRIYVDGKLVIEEKNPVKGITNGL